MDETTKKNILKCIANTQNPFIQQDVSSRDMTLKSVDKLRDQYPEAEILIVLKNELARLELLLEGAPGSMTGAEMRMINSERLWNCSAAIQHIEKAG